MHQLLPEMSLRVAAGWAAHELNSFNCPYLLGEKLKEVHRELQSLRSSPSSSLTKLSTTEELFYQLANRLTELCCKDRWPIVHH